MNARVSTAEAPLGFVTRASQTRGRGGPPLPTLTCAVRELPPAAMLTFEARGVFPLPFSKATLAPDRNPVPVMVTLIVLPAAMELGVILCTVSAGGVGVDVEVGPGVGVRVGVAVDVVVGVAVREPVGLAVAVRVAVAVSVGVVATP